MPTLMVAAFEEIRHWLIGRTRLNLHKVSSIVATLWTSLFGAVHVLPSSGATEHIVDLLKLAVFATGHLAADVLNERAGVAGETEAARTLLDYQHVCAIWTK